MYCRSKRIAEIVGEPLIVASKIEEHRLHISKHDAHSRSVIMFALLLLSLSFIVLLQLINPFHCTAHVMPHLPWPEFSRLAGTLATDVFLLFFRRIIFELCSVFYTTCCLQAFMSETNLMLS